MGAPDPEKRLHANRLNSTPWLSSRKNRCFSRSNHLKGVIKTCFGDGQAIEVVGDASDPITNPAEWPQDWPKAGKVLGVPKVVILSSFPYWACYQPGFNFYAPRDVIGYDGTFYNNYYYFDQWDRLDNSIPAVPDAYSKKNGLMSGDPDQEGDGDRLVAQVSNPYYQAHQDITAAFRGAKAALEAAGIGVIVPEWMPTHIAQQRNNKLTRNFKTLTHLQPCNDDGTVPIYIPYSVPWGPPYPNPDDARNAGVDGGEVPWLMCPEPGFGTDVLHLYVGHPNLKYPGSPAGLFGYQAWPLAPEAVWLGPVLETAYLGGDMFQPTMNGRRPIWRKDGYAYGYTGAGGAQGVYNAYGGTISGFADAYKKNTLKYRNFATKLFTYPTTWGIPWATGGIDRDRYIFFADTAFYAVINSGPNKTPWSDAGGMWESSEVGGGLYQYNFTGDPTDPFQALAAEHDVDVTLVGDCPNFTSLLPLYSTYNYSVPRHEIESAKSNLFPPIQKRVNDYYTGIEPGTAQFYQLAVNNNNLADYGVSYEGKFPGDLLSAGGIVDYVRTHFKT